MKTQYITDDKGNIISIVIPVKEYKRMLEDLEDIRQFDEVKALNEESIPFEDYLKKRQKKNNYV